MLLTRYVYLNSVICSPARLQFISSFEICEMDGDSIVIKFQLCSK